MPGTVPMLNNVCYYSYCPNPVRAIRDSDVGRDQPVLPCGRLGFVAVEPNYPAFASTKEHSFFPRVLSPAQREAEADADGELA